MDSAFSGKTMWECGSSLFSHARMKEMTAGHVFRIHESVEIVLVPKSVVRR
jgi:hypothetical protein